MTVYTPLQVAAFASRAGFSNAVIPVVVTISTLESGRDSDKVGDQSLADAKWGNSIGLMQVRSLRDPDKYSGADAMRVAGKLTDPLYNMQVSKAIYDAAGGKFTDWSTYNDRGKSSSRWSSVNTSVNSTLSASSFWQQLQAFGDVNRSQFWNTTAGQSFWSITNDDRTVSDLASGGASAVTDTVTSGVKATDSLLKLSETIQNGTFWKRVGIYAAGYVMILVGILFLLLTSSNVKSAAGVAGSAAVSIVPGGGAVKAAAGAVKGAGK